VAFSTAKPSALSLALRPREDARPPKPRAKTRPKPKPKPGEKGFDFKTQAAAARRQDDARAKAPGGRDFDFKTEAASERKKQDEAKHRRERARAGREVYRALKHGNVADEQAREAARIVARSRDDDDARVKLKTAGLSSLSDAGIFGRTVSDLKRNAVTAFPAMYDAGEALVLDTRDAITFRSARDPDYEPGKRSADIALDSAKGAVEIARHPLRHPGDTLLLGLGATSAVVGGATRVSAATRAASAAKGAGKNSLAQALVRPGYEGGSLLHKPVPGIRKIRVGDAEFQATFSKNPARAMVQKAGDRRAVRLAEKGRPAALNAKAARWGARERTITEAAENAPAQAVRAAGRKLTAGQQMALRAYIENTPLNDRIALATAELKKAASAGDRRALRHEIGLLRAAAPYLDTDARGNVTIAKTFKTPRRRKGLRGATPEEMRTQAARVVRGSERRKKQGIEMGLLDEKGAAIREQAPARIVRERPGLAESKISGYSLAHEDVGSTQAGRSASAGDAGGAGRAVSGDRAATQAAPGVSPGQVAWPSSDDLLDLSRAAVENHQGFRDKRLIDAALGAARNRIGYEGGDIFDAAAHLANNIQRQQALVDGNKRLGLAAAFDLLRRNGVDTAPIASGRLGPVMRGMAQKRITPERLAQMMREAGDQQPRARGYLGYGRRRHRDVVFAPFQSRSGAVPNKSPELSGSLKTFTGESLRKAAYEHDTSRVASTGMAAMNRHSQAMRLNQRLFAAGVPERPVDTLRVQYVPVRDRQLSPQAMNALQALAAKVEQDIPLVGQERVTHQRALRDLETPEVAAEALGAPAGAVMEGVRWVPKNVFERVSQAGQTVGSVPTNRPTRIAVKAWKEFNAGLRGIVLYSTGGGAAYITPNLLANVALLAMQGGPKIIGAAKRSLNPKFRKAVGRDAWEAGMARMGEGFMTSTFSERAGRGPFTAATGWWGRKLGRVTDTDTRMVSLVYEAGERGYKSPEQFRRLMTDPKLADDAMDVTIRARDAALDYELMSAPERSMIASWVFVYPFIRASTRYAANFPLDHPIQAAVYSQLAQIAEGNEELGDLRPPYEGLVKTGMRDIPGAGPLPEVVNVNAISPFTAPVDFAKGLGGFFGTSEEGPGRGGSLVDLANPAITAGIETITGRDSFTQKPVPKNVRGFVGQVANNIPLVRDVRQWGKSPEDLAKQVSPRTDRDIITRQFLGSLAPRPYNPEMAEHYAQEDARRKMPPGLRATKDVLDERRLLLDVIRNDDPSVLDNGRLPKKLRVAYTREAEVSSVRAKLKREYDGGPEYHRAALIAEARLLEKWGEVEPGFAADVEREFATATGVQLEKARTRLRTRALAPAYLDKTSMARAYMREHGIDTG
jgi:death-on-curing protein